MTLHLSSALPSKQHVGYPIVKGILEEEAISLLRSFYNRENFHAPEEKRKKKSLQVSEEDNDEEMHKKQQKVVDN